MDYSASNQSLWNPMTQLGILAAAILLANLLHRHVRLVRRAMIPVAVLAGFLNPLLHIRLDSGRHMDLR